MVYEITDESFDTEVAKSAIPCLIEFTAPWCTVCDDIAPAFEELAEEFAGQVKFCRVDVDASRALRIKFAVAALPYFVWVANNMKSPLFDCMVPQEQLKERIRFMLDGGEAPTTRPL